MNIIKRMLRIPGLTKAIVTLYDSVLGGICMYLAVGWRYSFEQKPIPSNIDENAALIFMVAISVVWVFTRTHKAIWRFTSLDDIKNLLQGVALASILTPLILFIGFNRAVDFPRSAPFIAGALFFLVLTLSRIIVVFVRNGDVRAAFRAQEGDFPNAILVGTADSLHNYLRDMNRKATGPGFNIIGLIDTDDSHKGRSISTFPILGVLDDIKAIYEDMTRREGIPPTLIATDTNTDKVKSYDLVKVASEMGAPLVRVTQGQSQTLTPFEAADLIGRNVKALDISPVKRLIRGKRIMITGAGGSIGSEITRQIAGLEPEHMILIDASEFNLYEIDRKLERDFSSLEALRWTPYLANVCDKDRLENIFETEKPEIIVHAAALKHVHLGELNPVETLKTNIIGTNILLELALKYEAQSFTLISTDKAVEPENIMGASKRIAELSLMSDKIIASDMSACAVRFGNVLASTGSVIPLFEEQIADGGPVTVTDINVNRFFMTTEEAGALVLQAAALNSVQRSDRTSIYVLEMGEPVNIAKLARQLIRLRGFVPDRDIEIKFTGLRPGEKLTETLNSDTESLETTYVKGISRISGQMSDPSSVGRRINSLATSIYSHDINGIKLGLKNLIPNFKPSHHLSNPDDLPKSAKIIPLNDKNKRT